MKFKPLLILLLITQATLAQNNDSLWGIWNNDTKPDTVRCKAIESIIKGYIYSNPDTTYYLSNLELNFCKKRNLIKGQISANLLIGTSFYVKGDFTNAIKYFTICLKLRNKIGDKKGAAGMYNNIALIYWKQGDLLKALDYNFKSLKVKVALDDKEGIADSYNNIGLIYKDKKDLKKALSYLFKSLELEKITNDKSGIAYSYLNISSTYKQMKEYEKALNYLNEAIKIEELQNNKVSIASIYSNMGNIYGEINKHKLANEYYLKAQKLFEEVGDQSGIITSYQNIGFSLILQKQYSQALKYCQKAMENSITTNLLPQQRDACSCLYYTYKGLNQHQLALLYHEKFIQLRDSVINQEHEKEMIEKEFQYEYEKKAASDSTKNAFEQQVKDTQIESQRTKLKQEATIKYGLYGVIALVTVFSFFLINRFRVTNQQKKIIIAQKHIVEEKQKEIVDSINYAKRLQEAILPATHVWKNSLPNSFIFYKPKDIVAGDFYWLESIQNTKTNQKIILFAVADCTGHGVPGAMVSVVCANALNRAVKEFLFIEPASILNKTRDLVIETFEMSESEVKDGMDISLCSLNLITNELRWAGANNPLWIHEHKTNSIKEISGDKQPIGHFTNPKPFSEHHLFLNEGDALYLFTDGYADQFGGNKGKKFKSSQLKELIISISKNEINDQKQLISDAFDDWKGRMEQIDDVCIVGIRI